MTSASSCSSSDSDVPPPYSAKIKECFAYVTAKDRWPVILAKIIDTICRDRHVISKKFGEAAEEEGKAVIARLSELRNQIMTNKPMVAFKIGADDARIYNDYLENLRKLSKNQPNWYESPWLFAECYLYRKVKEAFEFSVHLQDYDPFKDQKDEAFVSSLDAATSLGNILERALAELQEDKDKHVLKNWTMQFALIALWGNKCDLSLSAGKDDIQDASEKRQSQVDILRNNVIDDNTEMIWEILTAANKKHKDHVRVDYVLDNAGFELFTDLCFLDFLYTVGLVNDIRIYGKVMPWFVSDVVPEDFNSLLNILAKQREKVLVRLSERWKEYFDTKKFKIEEESFWTFPHAFCEMKVADPALYKKLSESDLIFFKGDLNYRKLTSDLMWKSTTPFTTALMGFLPAPLCSLRTVKADVVVGLEPGIHEELEKSTPNWTWTGEYATVQCAIP